MCIVCICSLIVFALLIIDFIVILHVIIIIIIIQHLYSAIMSYADTEALDCTFVTCSIKDQSSINQICSADMTMWLIVCTPPHWHLSDDAVCHLWRCLVICSRSRVPVSGSNIPYLVRNPGNYYPGFPPRSYKIRPILSCICIYSRH